jgi:ribosomal protein S18 acetylase RimI-like enzyme
LAAGTAVAKYVVEVVGVCTFAPARHANYEGWGELYSLYVHPHYHQGIGQQLIIQAHRRLKADYPQNYLLVLANNAVAQRFYQRNGFHDIGQIYVDHAPFCVLHERIFED